MAGKFLQTAYRVLEISGKPLTADQIVERGLEKGYLNSLGKTPGHTMRARLSEEMRNEGADSHFMRVGPNRFGLRQWNIIEYYARPFKKEFPDEVTVCVPGTIQDIFSKGILGIDNNHSKFIKYISDRNNLTYLHRSTAETTSKYKQLIAYVLLQTEDGKFLSYVRGKYSSAHKTLLLGRRSIGFGGHVLKSDSDDLFGNDDGGLSVAAEREITEEINAKILGNIQPVGIIWDDSSFEGQRHIGVYMKAVIESTNLISANEMSINQLELLSLSDLWEHYHQMEFWSQLIIRDIAKEALPNNISSISPSKRPKNLKAIAFVGEIASGKSSISLELSNITGANVVSASSCLSKIISFFPKGEHDRLEFQKLAYQFIMEESAPQLLAREIYSRVKLEKDRTCIVDGIRQLSTLTELRKLLPDLVVIYVECPRDIAFENYKSRWSEADLLSFAAVREHEVEREIPHFRYEADAFLHNADAFSKTISILQNWLQQ